MLHVCQNTDFRSDLIFTSGPLDVLDHSADKFSFGGKLGIDSTIKNNEEVSNSKSGSSDEFSKPEQSSLNHWKQIFNAECNVNLLSNLKIIIAGLNQSEDPMAVEKSISRLTDDNLKDTLRLILAVDHTVDLNNIYTITWQILGNSDPQRDIKFISDNTLFIDGTIKAFRKGGFPRKWPNVVCSSEETIKAIDNKWASLDIGPFIPSPSIISSKLCRQGTDEVHLNH